jgi:hypothetical protein
MARRRRHYGSYLTVPGLGDLKSIVKDANPLGQSVKMNDLLLGAAVGAGGGAVVQIAIGKTGIVSKLPGFVQANIGPVSTILAGVAGYLFYKKKNASKAKGILYGAALAGLVPVGWNVLRTRFPQYFSGYVTVPGLGEVVSTPMGMLVEEGGPALNALNALHDSDEAY